MRTAAFNKADKYINETLKLMRAMDSCGQAIILDKARDIAKQYPCDQPSGEVIQFVRKGAIEAAKEGAA